LTHGTGQRHNKNQGIKTRKPKKRNIFARLLHHGADVNGGGGVIPFKKPLQKTPQKEKTEPRGLYFLGPTKKNTWIGKKKNVRGGESLQVESQTPRRETWFLWKAEGHSGDAKKGGLGGNKS